MPGRQRIPRPAEARPGGAPPWARVTPGQRRGLGLDAVRGAVARFGPSQPPRGPVGHVSAAVLTGLFEEDGEARVILTRRSSRLRSHTGEVAFPGGRLEPGEAPLDAALREADEEVALDPAAVEIVGQLSAITTLSSSSVVTPFVGLLAARPRLRSEPREVERVFDVALAALMADGVYHQERWDLPGRSAARTVHFFDLPDDMVWGATGRILHELLSLVTAWRWPPR